MPQLAWLLNLAKLAWLLNLAKLAWLLNLAQVPQVDISCETPAPNATVSVPNNS